MYHSLRDENGRFRRRKNGKENRRVRTRVGAKPQLESYDLFILDKSSSMSSVRSVTINGVNEVFDNIRKASAKGNINSKITLVQFGSRDDYSITYDKQDAKSIANLNSDTYSPQGMTALHDAAWRSISNLRDHLDALGKLNEKISVTVYIFTDGQENASTISREQVKSLIEEVRDRYKWTVTFIGAGDITSVQTVAQNLGIFTTNTVNYAATVEGTAGIFTKMSSARTSSLSNYASGGINSNVGFFSNDNGN